MGRLAKVLARWFLCAPLGILSGCLGQRCCCDSAAVIARTGERMNHQVMYSAAAIEPALAAGATLTEEQAVLLALWFNPNFRELLAELRITHADLIQAGLLPNPEFAFFWHVVDKPYKFLFDYPLEALWLRPFRVKVARLENERACEKLVQSGLDLMRDVRQAYVDVNLA